MAEVDAIIDHFVDNNPESVSVSLLQAVALPVHGGSGYKINLKRMIDMDGYEFNASTKTITLDSSYYLSDMSVAQMSDNLRDALQVEILGTRASLISRVGWGTTNVVVGVIEVGVGFVGIVVPEPGTTVGGVAVFTLGVNSITDGLTQLAGANNGFGYNPLASGTGYMGGKIAQATGHEKEIGEQIGRNLFAVSSIAVGTVGSIKILRVKGQPMIRAGVGGRPGGLSVGRVDMMYGSSRAQDGMTFININNNANQSILRFVTHNGQLMANGRIVGVQRVLRHEASAKEILKGLIKLSIHGAKAGL